MSTILPKESVTTNRETVILSDAERRYLRRKLKASLAVTRDILNPGHQVRRLVDRKTKGAKQFVGDTVDLAKNHAPILGIAGVSALLFAARGPISRWISRLRQRKTKKPISK